MVAKPRREQRSCTTLGKALVAALWCWQWKVYDYFRLRVLRDGVGQDTAWKYFSNQASGYQSYSRVPANMPFATRMQAKSDAPALPRKESTGKREAKFGCTLARTLRGWCCMNSVSVFSGGSIKMAGTLRGAWLPGLLPARKNLGRRWTNVFFSVGQKKLLQVSMDGLPLQAPSNAPRGWAC